MSFKKWKPAIEITACVVADESELTHIGEWAARWNGPISILVTTTHPANSHHYNTLARRLSMLGSLGSHSELSKIAPSTKFRIAIHLLSIPFSRRIVPNTNNFLNIARIHSRSDTVMLFPLGLTYPPISNLHDKVLEARLGPDPVIIPRITHVTSPFPSPNSTANPNLPPSKPSLDFIDPGASLFILKDDPLWCPERFFTTPSPVKRFGTSNHAFHASMLWEWVECLWRVMLEHPKSLHFSRSRSGFTFNGLWGSPLIDGGADGSDSDLGRKPPVPDIYVCIVCTVPSTRSRSLLIQFPQFLDPDPREFICSISF
jgi:hypothetical protein